MSYNIEAAGFVIDTNEYTVKPLNPKECEILNELVIIVRLSFIRNTS